MIPPHLPRVAAALPAGDTVSAEVDRPVSLRFDVRPSAPGETVTVAWTVDGMPAGEGDTLRWSWSEPVNARARAVATSSLGSAVGREWRILVRAVVTTTTTTTTSTSLPVAQAAKSPSGESAPREKAPEETDLGEFTPPPPSHAEPAQPAEAPSRPPPTVQAAATPTSTVPPPPPPPPPPPAATSTTASAADRPADDSARAAAACRDGSGHGGRGAPAARPLCRGVEESRRR